VGEEVWGGRRGQLQTMVRMLEGGTRGRVKDHSALVDWVRATAAATI
jgi:hypothetical protein